MAAAGCDPAATSVGGQAPGVTQGFEISPAATSVVAGASTTFTARVAGVSLSGVQWSATAGSITSGGRYTAPEQPGTFQVYGSYDGVTNAATVNVVAPGAPAAFHAAAVETCAGMPLRTTGTVHYFCDCQTGAEAGCVAGNDANDGLSPTTPRRTWTEAVKAFNAMGAGDTIALCKGGLWNVPAGSSTSGGQCGTSPAAPALNNSRCAAGSSLTDPANTSTCDLRDYDSPLFTGTAKPVLYAYQSGATHIINRHSGSTNGVRVLNLELRGGNAGPRGGVYNNHMGIAFDLCNSGSESSWLVCNNTFANLKVGIIWDGKSTPESEVIWGNRFVMNDLDGMLGSPGNNGRIDANYFDNNGGFTHPSTGNPAHSLYLAPPSGREQSDVQVVNNEFRRSGEGSTPGACSTVVLVGHCYYTRLNVENNLIDTGASAAASCWNIDLRAAGSPPTHYRYTTVRRNWIIGTGAGIVLGQAPNSTIENNVVVLKNSGTWKVGIISPYDTARSGQDDVQVNTTIRNNTIYLAGRSTSNLGILVGTEGTGHVIANNVVEAGGGSCLSTPLSSGAYSYVGSNACHGGSWGTSYEPANDLTADPLFVAPPTDFTLSSGSPLGGAGNASYAPTLDFALKERSGSPSIGAYEP